MDKKYNKMMKKHDEVKDKKVLHELIDDHPVTGIVFAGVKKLQTVSTEKRVYFLFVDVLGNLAVSIFFTPAKEIDAGREAMKAWTAIWVRSFIGSLVAHMPAHMALSFFTKGHMGEVAEDAKKQ